MIDHGIFIRDLSQENFKRLNMYLSHFLVDN